MSAALRCELIHVFQKYFFLFQKNFLVHTFFFSEEKYIFYLVSLWDFNLINVRGGTQSLLQSQILYYQTPLPSKI